MKHPPLGERELVWLNNTYFEDKKRRDGQVGAILLFERHVGKRRVKDSIYLLAPDEAAIHKAISDWANLHAMNIDDLVAAESCQTGEPSK